MQVQPISVGEQLNGKYTMHELQPARRVRDPA